MAEATTTRAARPRSGRRRRGRVRGPGGAAEPGSRLGRGEGRAGCAGRRRGAVLPSAPVPPGGFAPGRSDRKIERSVALELATPADRMERLGEQVTAVTNRYGGFVLSSSLSTGEDDAGGEFDLRIPAARLRPALRDLAGLATVRSQSQSGRDVTRQHVTAQDRLRLGARRARQPAAAPRAGRHRRGGRGPAAPARPGGDRDPRPALAAPLPAAQHQLRDRDRLARDRRRATPAPPAPSTTRSTTPGTCSSARPEC